MKHVSRTYGPWLLFGIAVIGVIVATLNQATPARAETRARVIHLGTSGLWFMDYYPDVDGGMCLMKNEKQWDNGAMGLVMFKWTTTTGLFLHIGKTNWKIGHDDSVPLTISFDSGQRHGHAVRPPQADSATMLEVDIDNDVAPGFMADFAEANQLRISFDSGTEPDWTTPMEGSRTAKEVFDKCIAYVGHHAPTQPLAKSMPTQPFTSSAPTQPAKPTQPTQSAVQSQPRGELF